SLSSRNRTRRARATPRTRRCAGRSRPIHRIRTPLTASRACSSPSGITGARSRVSSRRSRSSRRSPATTPSRPRRRASCVTPIRRSNSFERASPQRTRTTYGSHSRAASSRRLGCPELVRLITNVVFLVVFVGALRTALRERTRTSVDATILFGALAVVIAQSQVAALLGTQLPTAFGLVSAVLLLALPYLQLRLVDDF